MLAIVSSIFSFFLFSFFVGSFSSHFAVLFRDCAVGKGGWGNGVGWGWGVGGRLTPVGGRDLMFHERESCVGRERTRNNTQDSWQRG